MRATDFEYRHQTLLHLLVVGTAFLTYTFQPDDIVWALVRHHTTYRPLLERLAFGSGALMIIGSAVFQTWANAYGRPRTVDGTRFFADGPYRYVQCPLYLGRILFVLGIGLLAPAVGTVILLTGEMLLVHRLYGRDGESGTDELSRQYRVRVPRFWPSIHPRVPAEGVAANWKGGVRREASNWGLAITMIVFTLTLQDRLAEILAGASFLLWLGLNLPALLHSNRISRHA